VIVSHQNSYRARDEQYFSEKKIDNFVHSETDLGNSSSASSAGDYVRDSASALASAGKISDRYSDR
jgi:hypothetical protein